MQKYFLAILFCFVTLSQSFSQCPSAGFSIPSSICIGSSFDPTNTTTNGVNYEWDFCAGDLERAPDDTTLGVQPLNSPDGIDFAFDGTDWYGFVCNVNGNSISRMSFGNSLNNAPSSTVALTISGAGLSGPWDIEVANDNGYWYALVNCGFGNNLVRIDLDSLNNDFPFATVVLSGLNFPFHSSLVKDGSDWIYLVANNGGNSIYVVNFGNSLSNNSPVAGNFPAGSAATFGPRAIAVGKDCDTWYGFVPMAIDGTLARINFGPTLTSTPVLIDTVANLPFAGVREIELVNENGKWYALILSGGGDGFIRLDFGSNLGSNNPVITPLPTLNIFFQDFEFCMEKQGSEYFGFATGYFANTIKRFQFPDICSSNIVTSDIQNPTGIIYSSPGTYNISLVATDANGNTDYVSDSIQVVDFPLAGFTFTSACINQPASFTDTSSAFPGTIISWIWDFGDGDSSLLQNPSHTYTNDSTYYVTLTVTSDAGCTATTGDSITISDLPQADFSFIDNQCAFADVQFNDFSIPPPGDSIVLWVWNYGDASPQDSVQNPTHPFTSTGTFTVLLTVYSGAGCFDTLSQSITIVPGPLADFTFSETCVGETVQFNNTSFIPGGGTLDYDWDFGDFTTSTATNPSHQYISTPANYQVTLVASSVNSCVDSVTKNIRISSKPNPGFIFSPVNACVGYNVGFNSTSTIAAGDSIDLQSWDFGDFSPVVTGSSVNHIYTTAGTYTITLTVNAVSDCDSSITQTITVTQCPPTNCPVATFDVTDSVCTNTALVLINNSYAGSIFDWDFCAGDLERDPTNVSLGIQSLNTPDGIDFAFDGTNWYAFVCNNFQNTISRIAFGNSLDNTPISTATLTLSGAGLSSPRDIEMANDNGQWYALVNNSAPGVNDLVRIDLDSLDDDSPDAAVVASGLNFPFHSTLVKDGTDWVYLVANNEGYTISVINFGNNLANNSPLTGTFPAGSASSFGPRAIAVAKDCDTWYGFVPMATDGTLMRVNFGSTITNTPVLTDTVVTLPFTGVREVELVNENAQWYALVLNGSGDSFLKLSFGSDLGNNNPVITTLATLNIFSSDYEFCLERQGSEYFGFTTCNNGEIKRFQFPDICSASDAISSAYIPTNISYSQTGTNYISLSVFDNDGNTDYYCDSVFVKPGPVAGFSYSPACLNNAIYFSDSTLFPQGTITNWLWDFGGLGTSIQQNPTFVFNNTGNFSVTLTATGSNGCSNSITQNVTVKDNPVANFSFPLSACSETPVLFSDLSTFQAPDSIITWDWNFDDGSLNSNLPSPVHVFDTGGVYNVQLIVNAITGCSDTIIQTITINSSAEANFTISQTCIGEITQFTNNTTGGVTNNYTWYFGDGDSSLSVNASHPYPASPGTYTAQLLAISSNGCNDTIEKEVRIGGKAIAGFSYGPSIACVGNTVEFIDTSFAINGDSIILSTWNFGDGPINITGDTVTHVYSSSGIYTVSLTVTTFTSCDTTITAIVNVLESPVASFTFQNVCLDSTMSFVSTSTTPGGTSLDSLLWVFGDGDSASGTPQSHLYTAAGTYGVTLYVQNNFGCFDTVQQTVEVYPNPDADFFTSPVPCASSPVNFFDNSTPGSITSYSWDFGDSGTSFSQNPLHTYQVWGTYNVSLTVTTVNGCINTQVTPVTVNPTPQFDFTNSNTCFGNNVQFTYVPSPNSPVPAVNWLWNFGDGLTSILQNPPPHPYAIVDSFIVTLTATATNTCAGVVQHTIYINATPQASFITDNNICLGEISSFNNTTTISNGTIQQWEWLFGDNSIPDNSQNPTHTYANAGNYMTQLVAISDSNCTDTAIVQISVSPLPLVSYTITPDYGAPPLDITIQNTTPGSNIFMWNFGDGTGTVPGTAPSHTYLNLGSYTVTMIATNNFGCIDSLKHTVDVVIPYLDLAIMSIDAVQQNNLLAISAQIRNMGNVFANNFEIRARTDIHSSINEFWNDLPPLEPGETLTYNFNARYEVDPANPPDYFCVEIMKVNNTNDALASNNRMCSSLIPEFELFDIHPNPAADEVIVSGNFPFEGVIELCIYNAIGQLVYCNQNIEVQKGYNQFTVDISHIAKAVYACTVLYNGNLKSEKFLKK